MSDSDVDRRRFLQSAVGRVFPSPHPGASVVDEGTEKVLNILQERAAVNTLLLAVFTYGRGIAGRQIPGQPLPDHGKQEYDLQFHGGNFATCLAARP